MTDEMLCDIYQITYNEKKEITFGSYFIEDEEWEKFKETFKKVAVKEVTKKYGKFFK